MAQQGERRRQRMKRALDGGDRCFGTADRCEPRRLAACVSFDHSSVRQPQPLKVKCAVVLLTAHRDHATKECQLIPELRCVAGWHRMVC
jgi:hypothetical protein